MINVLVPIVDRLTEYEKMIEKIALDKDATIFVGALEEFKDKLNFKEKNVIIKFFKNGSGKEEIINSLHSIDKESGKIILLRRPVSETEFDKLKTSKKDIAYLKKKRNKFSAWWHNLWKNLIKKIFAFYYFEDISAISFNTTCFNLLSSLTNLSYVTRIDRFVGFEMEEIDTENKAPKREYDKFYASAKVVGSGLFLIFCILISIIISSSFQPLFLMILISILLCLIGAVSLFVSVLNLARTIAVGTLRHGRAEEILN